MPGIWFACYHLLTWCAFPFLLLAAALHVLCRPQHLGFYLRRFALILPRSVPKTQKRVWIHGVDLGELLSCGPLIELFESNGIAVYLSTSARTAFETARNRHPGAHVFYFPFDYPYPCKRLLRAVKPDAVLLCEMEIWPAFVRAVKAEGVLLYLISGRMPRRDFRNYHLFRFFFRPVLALFDGLFMRSDLDARLIKRLCPHQNIQVLGNLKFDVSPVPPPPELSDLLPDGLLICAASTHRGDENNVMAAYQRLKNRYPDVRLIIAPRHLRRVQAIVRLARRHQLAYTLRSSNRKGDTPLFILDSMGELSGVFARCDLVVMGGSFSQSVGGHNLVEPSLYGKCILCGPRMASFEDLFSLYHKENALIVTSRRRLFGDLEALLQNPGRAAEVGARAFNLVERHRGAAQRIFEEIMPGLRQQEHGL